VFRREYAGRVGDLESNDVALQKPGNDHSRGEKPHEGDQSKKRYIMLADVKERLMQKRRVHVLV
jgi:hypothetical protein